MAETEDGYAAAWEGFWRDTKPGRGEAAWDSAPEEAAALHVPLFADLLAAGGGDGLPWVDLGCGNGTQSRYLARRFGRVVGIDLSPTAIEHARSETPDGEVDFRVRSALDRDGIRALHEELGDANVYLRGILHQSRPQDRPAVAEAVAVLVGRRGLAFDVEMAAAAKPEIQRYATAAGGALPKFAALMQHGLTPADAPDEAFPALFREAGLTVLRVGDTPLHSTQATPAGAQVVLPMRYLVARR
ncbi:class I SAM-dependent methyltransferase [Phaeacidiphilus oryzae]|jgi:SAM-dependent methyltransferase|uniref:class I SAM-dependent methyltransferase n=1 Tax=Phaeacidiphilus oryzae TaxID=348818 RepID=UPI000568B152|nr:class I SAM-dependent methyltransferase [Phaeacidiphilus oryzae]